MRFAASALVLMIFVVVSNAQTIDTLVLKNNDVLIGEIKSLQNNVLQMETPYSDSDFKIDFGEVKGIATTTYFLVNVEDGSRINGTLKTSPIDSSLVIIGTGAAAYTTELDDVVYLNSVKQNIWSRFDILLELGFNLTKANNLKQFSSRTALGYTANTWSITADYNQVLSSQDSIADIKRTDASVNARWFLPNDWFLVASSTFLQNDEQRIKLRATPSVGVGRYFVRNNHWIFNGSAGLAWNIESFQTDEPDRSSLEAFAAITVNLFNTGDFSTNLRAIAYPSLTESGRFRSDINWDMKYEFLDDFYFKVGLTYNYDNRPTAGASNSDYVFQTTVGWTL